MVKVLCCIETPLALRLMDNNAEYSCSAFFIYFTTYKVATFHKIWTWFRFCFVSLKFVTIWFYTYRSGLRLWHRENLIGVLATITREDSFAVPGEPMWSGQNVFETDYGDVIMCAGASKITSVSVVCSRACSGADQIKHWAAHRWPLRRNPPLPGEFPSQRASNAEMFQLDDGIMNTQPTKLGTKSNALVSIVPVGCLSHLQVQLKYSGHLISCTIYIGLRNMPQVYLTNT